MKNPNPSTTKNKRPRDRNKSRFRAEMEEKGIYTNQVKMSQERKREIIRQFRDAQLADIDSGETRNLTARRFFLKLGYRMERVHEWIKEDPVAREDYMIGLQLLGDKREVGMMRKELSEKSTMYTMHLYLDDWKSSDDYHDKRQQKKNSEAIATLLGKTFEVPELESE